MLKPQIFREERDKKETIGCCVILMSTGLFGGRNTFCQVSTQQGPIFVLVLPWYTNTE